MIPYGYRRSIQAALFLVAGLCATSISQSQAAYFEGFDSVSSLISNGDPLKWAWLNQSDNPSSGGGWWQASSTLSERSFNPYFSAINQDNSIISLPLQKMRFRRSGYVVVLTPSNSNTLCCNGVDCVNMSNSAVVSTIRTRFFANVPRSLSNV